MNFKNEVCACGKMHLAPVDEILTGSGVIKRLPEILKKYAVKKPFILSDVNTYKAAGEKVCQILSECNIEYSQHIFTQQLLEPDEAAVGSAVMHFDNSCDAIVGVGSGVINDIGKVLSHTANKIYIIVATAPSMDGYASQTSSMSVDGVKVSLNTKCAEVIIGDTDILCNAPSDMLKAGIGDMLAKYISICEWRIANIITGEYYCEKVAELVRESLKKCVTNAGCLLERKPRAVEAVFEGLVNGGIAMAYAGVSRPASGVEHYISHIWDMRGLEFGTAVNLHGIQCAVGTLAALELYNKIRQVTPSRNKAIKYAENFDYRKWSEKLTSFLGKGATSMIKFEEKEQKYSAEKHRLRVDVIIKNIEKIFSIIDAELPSREELIDVMKKCALPLKSEEIGIEKSILPMTFKATKDIRDKYILSRLAWDLGIIDEMAESL